MTEKTDHPDLGDRLDPAERLDQGKRDQSAVIDHSDRWIYGVWIVMALVAVAILPFASRMGDVARAIASFCGFTIS